MWSRLSAVLNEASRDAQRGLDDLGKQLKSEWNDVVVQCPNCTTSLKVPRGACVFRCSSCDSNINRPKLENKLSYHSAKYANKFLASVSDALGQTREVQVIVPEGSRGGDTIQVPAGVGGALLPVVVPQGLESGQSFMMQVPASAAHQRLVYAVTDSAPTTPPTATPVSSSPVPNSASSQPSAPSEGQRFTEQFETTFDSLRRQVEDAWKDVVVRCPSCAATLHAPPDAELFNCGRCGVSMKSPDVGSKVELHVNRLGTKLSGAVGDMFGQTRPIQVTVPPGTKGGDSCQVQADRMRGPITVVIPEGMEPGQIFTYKAPASVFERSYVARTQAAPATVPVAEAIESQPSGVNQSSNLQAATSENVPEPLVGAGTRSPARTGAGEAGLGAKDEGSTQAQAFAPPTVAMPRAVTPSLVTEAGLTLDSTTAALSSTLACAVAPAAVAAASEEVAAASTEASASLAAEVDSSTSAEADVACAERPSSAPAEAGTAVAGAGTPSSALPGAVAPMPGSALDSAETASSAPAGAIEPTSAASAVASFGTIASEPSEAVAPTAECAEVCTETPGSPPAEEAAPNPAEAAMASAETPAAAAVEEVALMSKGALASAETASSAPAGAIEPTSADNAVAISGTFASEPAEAVAPTSADSAEASSVTPSSPPADEAAETPAAAPVEVVESRSPEVVATTAMAT